MAITVTLTELPVPDGYGTAGVANLASDGTVVGMVWPDGLVARWVPGADPEVLGGGLTFTLENMMPLISKDGSVIATCGYFSDGTNKHAAPELWTAGSGWIEASGLTLGDATPYGMSYDGQTLVGGAFPVEAGGSGAAVSMDLERRDRGQQALGMIDGTVWGRSLGRRRRWSYSRGIFRSVSRAISRATARAGSMACPNGFSTMPASTQVKRSACNSDCSVIVGAGRDADSPQAWRWTAQRGFEFLGTVEGASADAMYYAFESSEDGTVIVGSYYTTDPLLGAINRGFMWTPADHMQDLTAVPRDLWHRLRRRFHAISSSMRSRRMAGIVLIMR